MPELPEVESARAVVERGALGRRIVDVDDSDTWECRPHAPGEIREALLGRTLVAAHRRGKSMWCTTSAREGDDPTADDAEGPALGLHLGMSGRILVRGRPEADGGEEQEGGDYAGRTGDRRKEEWYRFTLRFADGGSLRLLDPRRLGRVRLDPDLTALGPDAAEVGREAFRARVGRGTLPLKARLLDQATVAGIGNLLADETLWQAHLSPLRPAGELDDDQLDHLRRVLRRCTRAAIERGGVHTGEVIGHRRAGAHCPRCGAAMTRATVGGRTTWWCPQEQV
ncbi:formamidopyrimidine-DNA glycosylase [Nocardioides sp. ChNu-153]|uniref:Fpg/Nei family DNA glycosylase n=1 Tax=Nocardioides sp. ChNu-153 TaxID=2779364 RepID=UPI0026544706|nr:DNA-formamidopyrimidine glycosylase family protein [Nocardioides sp. ChNu-153]MDN7122051.1 formamidopyrimidine-DNA glycosylase [Nocardioides sp. ChNu-153]